MMLNFSDFNVTMRLINPTWPLKIYKGYDIDKKCVYLVISKYKPISLLSTKMITVKKFYDNDQAVWRILFCLKSDSHSSKSMFDNIFNDIINSLRFINTEEQALKTFCTRYEHWQRLLSKIPETFGRLQQQGLLSELYIIKDILIPRFGVSQSIEMWQGPKGDKQDFILPKTWIEVKSVSLGKRDIHISSLDQLNSDIGEGYLTVVTLQESNIYDNTAISLSMLIDEIESMINDELVLIDFRNKLLLVGYGMSNDEEFWFKIINVEIFIVDQNFPMLKRRDVPTAIRAISYTLDMDAIMDFNICLGEIIWE